MDIVDSILNFTSTIGNYFGTLINSINIIGKGILNFLNYVLGIIKGLWYGFTTLSSGVKELFDELTSGGSFSSTFQALNSLTDYIGYPGVTFIFTLLFIILVKIVFDFVFKLFFHHNSSMRKTNFSENKSSNWEPSDVVEDVTYERLRKF